MLCCERAERPVQSEQIVFEYSDDFIVVRYVYVTTLAIRENA